MNAVILIGRLVRDPENKYTTAGKAVTTFTLAVDRQFTNQQGEREADYIPIITWGKLAETCANHLTKGRLVAVEGRLQIRTYDAQDGQKRKAAEVVANSVQFLDHGKQGEKHKASGEINVSEINLDDLPL
jgi:single-strand DNA-binding protein